MRRTPEGDLLNIVLDLAKVLGYRTAHFRAAKTAHGWRTPVSGDGKGFPDLVLIGHGRVLFRELKSDTGRLKPEQQQWLDALTAAGADAGVWRPRDLQAISADLQRKTNQQEGE